MQHKPPQFAVTVKLEFDTAHRIIKHESKCKYVHGHRYTLEVTASGTKLDNVGRIVDFGILKNTVKKWIDEHLDHNTILAAADSQLGDVLKEITGQQVYYLPTNPTCENIALHLKEQIIPSLFKEQQFNILRVRVYETPNNFSEVY